MNYQISTQNKMNINNNKEVSKLYQQRKYGITMIYFNIIIILNLIFNLIRLFKQTSSSQISSNDQEINNSNTNSAISKTSSILCWGGYLIALILLNSIIIIKCKQMKEQQLFWIKQTFLSISLLIIILEINLSEDIFINSSTSTLTNNQQNTKINIFSSQRYQTQQISLLALTSFIEIIPFQVILVLINQVYFIFIRQEIYSQEISDQVIFFGVYFVSISALVYLHRLQDRFFQFQNAINHYPIQQLNVINSHNHKKMNIQSNFFDCGQFLQQTKDNQTQIISIKNKENEMSQTNEQEHEDSFTHRYNLYSRDASNNLSSRPLYCKNENQKQGLIIQNKNNNHHHNNFCINDNEEKDCICKYNMISEQMKLQSETDNLHSHQMCLTTNRDSTNQKQYYHSYNNQFSLNPADSQLCKHNSKINECNEQEEDKSSCFECCIQKSQYNGVSKDQKNLNHMDRHSYRKSKSSFSDESYTQSLKNDIMFSVQSNQPSAISSANIYRTRKSSHFREEKPENEVQSATTKSNKKKELGTLNSSKQQNSSSLTKFQCSQSNSSLKNGFPSDNINNSILNATFNNNPNNKTIFQQNQDQYQLQGQQQQQSIYQLGYNNINFQGNQQQKENSFPSKYKQSNVSNQLNCIEEQKGEMNPQDNYVKRSLFSQRLNKRCNTVDPPSLNSKNLSNNVEQNMQNKFTLEQDLSFQCDSKKNTSKNLSVFYQVFFNFFPEGIVFIDSDLNLVYSNNTSKLLFDCKDNKTLKEVILNLPNVKSELNQACNQQNEETQIDSRHKVSFESFKHINYQSPRSTEQFTFNYPQTNNNNNNSLNSEKVYRSKLYLNEEQSPIKLNSKKIQSMLLGNGGGSGQSLNQNLGGKPYSNDNNSFQTLKQDKYGSNQVNFQSEIQKHLYKTQQYIHYNNMDNSDSNMILNEAIIFHSIYKKNNQSNPQNYSNLNNNNNVNQSNNLNNQSLFTPTNNQNTSQLSIKMQMNNNQNNNNNNNTINQMNPLGQQNILNQINSTPKDRCNSFQLGQIASSIYGSSNITNPSNYQYTNMNTNLTNNLSNTANTDINSNNNNNNSNNTNNINNNINTPNNNSNNNLLNAINSNNLSVKSPISNQTNITNMSYLQLGSTMNINNNNNNNNIQSVSTPNSMLNQNGNNMNQYGNNNNNNGLGGASYRKSSIQFHNGCNQNGGGGLLNQAQINHSFMNFQFSQQCIDKGHNNNQENMNETRELEISLFPSVIEGRAMILVMLRDVTHRKYIQHLKMANIHKQQMVSYLSHELRNPLNCIINMLDTVEYDIRYLKKINQNQVSIEDIQNNITTAIQNSKYILNLSNDYLDMTRIKAAQFKLNIEPFNLLTLLKDCMKLFSIQAYKVNTQIILKNRTIKNQFYFDTTNQYQNMVYSDPERIKQVIINLISNALKFTQNGRIFLIAEYTNINTLQVSVKDTGIGIEQSKIKLLFKEFGKIEDEENKHLNQQGVGLGLLISNMLSIQLSKPPNYQDQQNNNMHIGSSNVQINASSQINPQSPHHQPSNQNKYEKGLIVESEKGIGTTFALRVTDHNPYYKLSKPIARQAIQQITETQESSALLSQSFYDNSPMKKFQLDKDTVNKYLNNTKMLNVSESQTFKPKKQLNNNFSQTQANFLRISTKTNIKYKSQVDSYLEENQKSSIIIDDNQIKFNSNKKINSQYSLTEHSQIDISENMNEYQGSFVINNNSPQKQSSPQISLIKTNNMIMTKQHSPSPLYLHRMQKQYFIQSTSDIPNTIANTVKNCSTIKNKFKSNITTQIEQNNESYLNSNQHQSIIKHRSTSNKNIKQQQVIPLQSQLKRPKANVGEEDILIVDDNIFCCDALKNIIEKRFGLSCMTQLSVFKALEAVKERFSNQRSNPNQKLKQQTSDIPIEYLQNGNSCIEPSIMLESLKNRDPSIQQYTISNKVVDSEETIVSDQKFFKFIFLDINMPDVNGFEGLYQIKTFLSQVYPNFSEKCLIIGCSGVDESYLEDQFYINNMNVQFDGFLFKPVFKEKLIEFFSNYNISMIN